MRRTSTIEGKEAGYTLVETAVALALLVGVLVPVAAAVLLYLGTPREARMVDALTRVEAALETAPVPLRGTVVDKDGPWRISLERAPNAERLLEGHVEVIRARAYFGAQHRPLAELTRARSGQEPGGTP